jgi:hypothetical protein
MGHPARNRGPSRFELKSRESRPGSIHGYFHRWTLSLPLSAVFPSFHDSVSVPQTPLQSCLTTTVGSKTTPTAPYPNPAAGQHPHARSPRKPGELGWSFVSPSGPVPLASAE